MISAHPEGCQGRNFAYKQMNYVFTYGMFFGTTALHKYRYWMRLDSDTKVLQPATQDPFRDMMDRGLTFAYRERKFDGGGCTEDQAPWVRSFLSKGGIQPPENTLLDYYLDKATYFYGNLGAGDLTFFTSPEYKSLAEDMLRQGGIWTHRWDDQHMYAIATAIFHRSEAVGPISLAVSHAHDRGW